MDIQNARAGSPVGFEDFVTPFEFGGFLFDIGRTIVTAVVAALVVRAITRSRYRTLPSGEPDPANRARACATASWLLTVGAMATSFLSPSRMRFLSGVAGSALMVCAVAAGLYALTRVRRHGSSGIVAPALAGLSLNALLVVLALLGQRSR